MKHTENTEHKTKYRNSLQKQIFQSNTEMHCKNRYYNQMEKCIANTDNTTEYRNALQKKDQIQKYTAETENMTKHRNALQVHCKAK